MKRNSLFTKLIFNQRQYNISIILVSQNYKTIPKQIRTNASGWIVFELAQSDMKSFYEENAYGFTLEEFMDIKLIIFNVG